MISENKKISYQDTLRVLPHDVRYYNPYGTHAGVVLVMEPSLQTLKIDAGASVKEVQYDFPYLVLLYNAQQQLHLFFAYEPVTEKTPLYHPILPNFHGHSLACFGNVKRPAIDSGDLKKLKAKLWAVIFNCIYTGHSSTGIAGQMAKGERIAEYATNKKAGNPVQSFKSAVNTHVGQATLNLFQY